MSEEIQRPGPGLPGLDTTLRIYRRSSPQRRVLLFLGSVSFLTGIVLLAMGVASLGDSTTQVRPGPAVIDITPSPTARPQPPTPIPSPTPVPAPPLGDQPYRMIIEKLGVDAPVNAYGLDAEAVPEVPTGSDAPSVVAWYNFSAKPGVGSNAVFAGHVTWNGPAVFYNLVSLAAGDVIRLRGDDGNELAYTVSEVYSVDPNDPESLSVMAATSRDAITLITCDGTYVDTNDPVFGGEYSTRLVIRAVREAASVAEVDGARGGLAP